MGTGHGEIDFARRSRYHNSHESESACPGRSRDRRLIASEERRQREKIRLIPSENYVCGRCWKHGERAHQQVLRRLRRQALLRGTESSIASRRCAIERAKSLFGADTRQRAALFRLARQPGHLFRLPQAGRHCHGMGLPAGGHLTHGWNVSISGKFFKAVQYGVREETGRIDFDDVRQRAREHAPSCWCRRHGDSAHDRFRRLAAIAREVGAICARTSRISRAWWRAVRTPRRSPTSTRSSTTHKTLRGPRGGMTYVGRSTRRSSTRPCSPACRVAPTTTPRRPRGGPQGGRSDQFRATRTRLSQRESARRGTARRGLDLVSGGTDNHLILTDLTPKGVGGKPAAHALDNAGLESTTTPFHSIHASRSIRRVFVSVLHRLPAGA